MQSRSCSRRRSTDISAVLGVDPRRVLEALHRPGIPMRTRGMRSTGGRSPLTKELLEELYVRQGLSVEAIHHSDAE